MIELNDWQPISSAPRDGTTILGYAEVINGYIIETIVYVHWESGREGWSSICYKNSMVSGFMALGWEPTHWTDKPLPLERRKLH